MTARRSSTRETR